MDNTAIILEIVCMTLQRLILQIDLKDLSPEVTDKVISAAIQKALVICYGSKKVVIGDRIEFSICIREIKYEQF
jgi:hypothetical protein